MKTKKILALVALILSTMLLATACTSGAQQTNAASTAAAPAASTEEAPAETAAAEPQKHTEKLKVAFVYNGSVGDNGWNDAQEKARKETQEELNDIIETTYIEPVTPGTAAEQVFTELGDQGYDVVVAATMAYESDVHKIAPEYPDTYFLICSGSSSAANVESFWPDRTALWYMYGVMAGLMTKTNKIGFTGSNPIPLVICCQNAFLLGAQSVNPDITQTVIYIGTFYDPAAETDAAYTLAEAGCDVLWNNTDTPSHVQVAQEKGLYAMSQYADQRDFGADSYLGGEILNWAPYYKDTFRKIYEGTFTPTILFPGLETECCLPQPYTKNIPDDVRAEFEKIYAELLASDNMYEIVYKGPIYDNEGTLRCPEGEFLGKDTVQNDMNWFVKGTISSVK